MASTSLISMNAQKKRQDQSGKMNNLNELPKKYPSLFKKESFSFECGNGWYELLDVLCSIIERRQLRGSVPSDDIKITQIKEKFGTLRFYYEGGDDVVYALSNFAESISGRVCEDCGQPGRTRSGGWVRTLCDFHAEEMGYHTDERF